MSEPNASAFTHIRQSGTTMTGERQSTYLRRCPVQALSAFHNLQTVLDVPLETRVDLKTIGDGDTRLSDLLQSLIRDTRLGIMHCPCVGRPHETLPLPF